MQIEEDKQTLFLTCFLCAFRFTGVLITGDAFNLFVFLEISSLSTYVMVAKGANRDKRALTTALSYYGYNWCNLFCNRDRLFVCGHWHTEYV